MTSFWNGVLPAITTPFAADGQVDHEFLARHVAMMMDAGCTGIVPLGSLGEKFVIDLAVGGKRCRDRGQYAIPETGHWDIP